LNLNNLPSNVNNNIGFRAAPPGRQKQVSHGMPVSALGKGIRLRVEHHKGAGKKYKKIASG